MAKEKKEIVFNPLLRRYDPLQKYTRGDGYALQRERTHFVAKDFGESITDKDSYRLSLATARATMSSVTGSPNVGQYMYEDGVYDREKDVSYLLRKDLSIVQIDDYIQRIRSRLDKTSDDLKAEYEQLLADAKARKADLEKRKTDTEKAE